jgi:nucleotidyltransferase/DNA polymerase involved in DNA repair
VQGPHIPFNCYLFHAFWLVYQLGAFDERSECGLSEYASKLKSLGISTIEDLAKCSDDVSALTVKAKRRVVCWCRG